MLNLPLFGSTERGSAGRVPDERAPAVEPSRAEVNRFLAHRAEEQLLVGLHADRATGWRHGTRVAGARNVTTEIAMQRTHMSVSSFRGASVAVVALLVSLATSTGARAQVTVSIDGTTLRVTTPEGTRVIDIECSALDALTVSSRVYAACGADGFVSLELDRPDAIERRWLGGPVVGLIMVQDVVWARLEDGSLRRTDEAAPPSLTPPEAPPPVATDAPAIAPRPSPPLPPSVVREMSPRAERPSERPALSPVGRVTRVAAGYALIALDEPDSLVEGGTVEFLTRPTATDILLESERDDLVPIGRGVVDAVAGQEARIRTEVNAPVRAEMWVRPADAGDLLWLPPEPLGVATLSMHLRPFIPMRILGFGAINDLSIGYTTGFGLALRLETTGFSFGVADREHDDAEHMPFMPVVHGYIGAVTRWFELGLGLGWSRSYRVRAVGTERSEGFSVLTMLRVGTEDGLSLRVRFTFLVREVWEVGDLYLDGRIPVAHGVWFIAAGGGGNTGVRYGEAGVRFLVEGNGRGGSLFLRGTIGVGMIEQGPNFSNAGPMVGLGLDARL